MALLKFHATNIWRAFLLNSIVAALTILMALIIKGHFDTYVDERGHKVTHQTNTVSVGLTLIIAFITSFLAYTVMYFLFGFGRAMTVTS